MARQYTIKIGVDLVTVNFQRNSTDNPDSDLLTLWATSSRTPNSRYSVGPASIGTSLSSGQTLNLSPVVETAEFIVTDEDAIQVNCYVTNQSHTDPTKAISDGMKIAAGVLATLAAGEALKAQLVTGKGLQDFFNKDAAIAAVIAGVLAAMAEFIGDLAEALGLTAPDCDGPVFSPGDSMRFNVGDLVLALEATAGGRLEVGVPQILGLWTDDTQISQSGCGHNPSITLRPVITFTTDPIPEQVFPPSLNDPPVKTDALLAKNPAEWANTWCDQEFAESSSIVVKVTQQETFQFKGRPMIAAPEFRAVATAFKDRILNNPNLGALLGTSPAAVSQTSSSSASDGELHVELTEKFAGTHGIALQAAASSLASVPMSSFPFAKPLLQPDPANPIFQTGGGLKAIDVDTTTHGLLSEVTTAPPPSATTETSKVDGALIRSAVEIGGSKAAAAPSLGQSTGAVAGLADLATALRPMYSDSVVVGNGVTLQYFGAFDKHDRLVGPRLRYLHVDQNHKIITDVMLQPASVPIK